MWPVLNNTEVHVGHRALTLGREHVPRSSNCGECWVAVVLEVVGWIDRPSQIDISGVDGRGLKWRAWTVPIYKSNTVETSGVG
jgi:hypothetical protein